MQLVNFEVAKKLLAQYKIPTPRTVFVSSEKEAAKAIKGFKFPVFIKIYGKNILHRTEINGVVGVENRAEFMKNYARMKRIKGVEGVLIQEKTAGKNLIIGMRRDVQFGPVILAGIGGIFAEAIKDVALRVAPVSEKEALKMLTELKGFSYLAGKRDKKKINFKAVAKIIVAVSNISIKQSEIKEIDLNPVMVDEKKAIAVDFKFLV